MSITIKYFGITADAAGTTEEPFHENVETLAALRKKLEAKHSNLEGLHYRMAVNLELVEETCAIPDGGEVALLPPYSGG